MQDRSPPTRRSSLATHGRTIQSGHELPPRAAAVAAASPRKADAAARGLRADNDRTSRQISDGRNGSALPGWLSNVGLLGYGQSVIYLDAEIANGAFDLGMAKQQLDGPQVAGAPIDQRRLSSTQ